MNMRISEGGADAAFDDDPTPRDSRTTSRAGSLSSSDEKERQKLGKEIAVEDGLDVINVPGDNEAITQSIADPPDGGLRAWLIVLGGHCVIAVTWGYANSFGFFQSHYLLTVPNTTPSLISWIGSIQLFCLFFVGTFSGQLLDIGYFRPTFLLGCALLLLGIFTTSLSTTYIQLLLSHGLCVGIGNGLLFVPTVSLVSTYFRRNRGLAIAIGASGSGTGGALLPLVIQTLLPRLGFPSTIRVLGGIVAGILIIPIILLRTRLPPRKSTGIIDLSVFKDTPYLLFALGIFLGSLGLFVPFYYISTYTRILQLPDSSNLPTYTIVAMNVIGIPGRLIPGRVADILTGPLTFIAFSSLVCGILTLAWIQVTTLPGIWAFTFIYGFFGASVQSLFPATLASMVPDMRKMGTWSGMVCSFMAFACLVGSPIAGVLVSRRGGIPRAGEERPGRGVEVFRDAQIFAGVMLIAGAGVMAVGRQMRNGGKLLGKV